LTRMATNSVTQVGPATASQAQAKVQILSFSITAGVNDTLTSVAAHYTGTSAADIAAVYLYEDAANTGSVHSFDLADTPLASTSILNSTNVTTDSVAQEASSATQSQLKVPILSFQLTAATADSFNQIVAHYTGTAAADVGQVYLYEESGTLSGSTFNPGTDT